MASPDSPAMSREREALIAAWQALGTSQPLCEELQNLCLTHMRDRTTDTAVLTMRVANPSNQESAPLLPPQRYTRRSRSSNIAPPKGPSKPTEATDTIKPSDIEWTNVAPDGPTDGHQNAFREDMDKVFHAIRTLH
jgi:hypothetical protein